MKNVFLLAMLILTSIFSTLHTTQSASAQQDDEPIPAAWAAGKMTAPPGFQVSLFAGEPDVVQPIAMTFDSRGRLWVVECLSYPHWSTEGVGHDRVTILEDTNQDGQHDKRTVFLDNGVNLTGIELGLGGVWLTATPNLLFVADRNADDVPDSAPEIVLDGWDLTAKHNVFNSLTWGPDGWLYGCNGILSHSRVGRPGTPDDQRTPIDCGVWRYHPQRQIFDVVASGSTNPWGLDFDEFGQAFITNCVIKHLFHIIPGAHYDRMFGQDLNPYAYELLPSCADHIHWGGGHWTTARGGDAHDDAGGGHAHSGCAIYLADQFPAEYRNNVFMSNIHGNRLNRDRLQLDGASYQGLHAPDFVHANDPWFRGIAVKSAPDGSLFVTDWTDTGECHNYEVVDASNGRVFRIGYGQSPAPIADVAQASLAELVNWQFSRNEWLSRQSRRQLHERCTADPIAGADINSTRSRVSADLSTSAHEALKLLNNLQPEDDRQAVRKLWAIYAVGGLSAVRAAQLDRTDAPEWVRFWTIQYAADEASAWPAELRNTIAAQLEALTPLIERSLASTCQHRIRLGFAEDVLPILARLLQHESHQQENDHADHAEEGADEHANAKLLSTLKWYAVEPLVASHTEWVLGQLASIKSPLVQRLIARRLISLDGGLARLVQSWNMDHQGDWVAASLAGVLEATQGLPSLPAPQDWNGIYARLQQTSNAEVRELSRQLSTLFGDRQALAEYRTLLVDRSASTQQRMSALQLLQTRQAEEVEQQLIELLGDPGLDTNFRRAAIRALAAVGGDDVAARLLSQYSDSNVEEKQEVVYALTTRLSYAKKLLDAIESGGLPRADVSSLVIRQLQALGDQALSQRLETVWGKVRPVSETKLQQIEQYRLEFAPDLLDSADVRAGQVVYQKTCGACHKLFGQGGSIGPELTGGQRHNLDYLLDNVIDPNAIVPGDYRMVMLLLDDGRILNGIIAEENPQSIQLKTATDVVTVPHDRIEERRASEVSMMPEGILDNLTSAERRDLMAFLQAAAPPVPNPASAADSQRPDPDGVGRWHLLTPPWKSATIYGESVTLLQAAPDSSLAGRLAFPVEEILSIVSSNREQNLTASP
ncbi:MAG: PVC-type heme-binding CxxCH protein, partial [Aureliella sp.]